jgi:uncharacterized protein YndB with AHSA1/START domain
MTLRASYEIDVPPQRAAEMILSPEGTRRWFPGIDALQADEAWPGVGSHMRWTVNKGRFAFDAKVLENRLPESLTLSVRTPSATSRIVHRFEGLPESRCRYVKTVEPRWHNRLMGPLLSWLVTGPAVRREVRRAAELASGPRRHER